MKRINLDIETLINEVLKEEIEIKSKQLSEETGEWMEIDMEEELHGGQKKLDVAEPKGKLTAADFKKLRDDKEEMDEFFFKLDDEDALGDYEGDEESEEEAEELSAQEPTYVGRGLADNKPGKMFDSFTEAETEEGNAFTGARQQAIDAGKTSFDFEGERYPVKGSKGLKNESKSKKCPKCGNVDCKCESKKETKEAKEKWIQKTEMKKGALHKKLGVPEDETIPQAKLKSLKKELMKKGEGDKKLSAADAKLLKQVNLALTLKGIKEETKSLKLTEEELINLIENIVNEQIVKDKQQKDNISKVKPMGLKKTEKVLDADNKENEDYAKSVTKKLKDYLKTGSKGKFEENPKSFPKGNGELGEMQKKAYKASKAVDEYIRDFAYPGLENTKYDEIKPNEEWLSANLEGSSKTGNNPNWANAVDTGLGKKVNEKRKKNAYQKEKMRSYNRYTQPVDTAGEHEGESSVDAMFKKLESTDDKKEKLVSEDIVKMKNLIGYNRKTQ